MTASIAALATGDTANRVQYEQFLAALDVDQVRPLVLERLERLEGLERLGGEQRTDVAVLDAKLEPGRPAVVLYRVGARLVHGTIPVPDRRAAPGPGLRLSGYPVDPGLPGLACAESAQCLARSIERGHLDGPVSVTRIHTRLLRYRPGRRATFEVLAHLRDQVEVRPTRLVAKVYHDRAKADPVVLEARELSRQAVAAPLVLARVVAHDPAQAIVVQEHLPGRPLTMDVGGTSPETSEPLVLAARALAAFHGLSVSAGRDRPLERELQRFVTRSTGVRTVDQETGVALLDLAERLRRLPRPDLDRSLVHGDCKPAQFLVNGPHVALLDLDHCGLAAPEYDVGNFMASLRQQVIQDSGPSPQRAVAVELGADFLDAYAAARWGRGGGAPPVGPPPAGLAERVEAFVAISVMRKALRAFARDPRSPIPRQLVDEAHRGLDDLGGAHP